MQSTNQQLPRGLLITCLILILFWGISEAQSFLIPISIAALLSFTMAPFVRVMRNWRFPEWSAIIVAAIVLVLPFLSLLSLGVWQAQSLVRDFPKIMEGLNQAFGNLVNSDLGQKLHLAKDFNVDFLLRKFEVTVDQGIKFLISGLGALLGAGSQLALVLLFAILMLASREHLERCAKRILKESTELDSSRILEDIVLLIEKFLIARLLIVLIVGGIDTVILMVFKVDYAFLMGSFLGLMTLIPVVGFLIGAAPPIVVSLAMKHSIFGTLLMFLCLFAMSIIEGNVLTPKMVGKRLNINALTTFIGLFGGGLLWGIWGMFLSIPVLGALRIIFNSIPGLQVWGELLAEKDDKVLKLNASKSKDHRAA